MTVLVGRRSAGWLGRPSVVWPGEDIHAPVGRDVGLQDGPQRSSSYVSRPAATVLTAPNQCRDMDT